MVRSRLMGSWSRLARLAWCDASIVDGHRLLLATEYAAGEEGGVRMFFRQGYVLGLCYESSSVAQAN